MKKEHLLLTAVLIAVVGFFGIQHYVTTPEYIAKKNYKIALQLIDAGDLDQGLTALDEVIKGESKIAPQARTALLDLINREGLSPDQKVQVFQKALAYRNSKPGFDKSLQSTFDEYRDIHPIQAGQLAMLMAELQKTEESWLEKRQLAYELLLENVDSLSNFNQAQSFALLDEYFNECANCPSVLEKYRNDLGHSEAARALGQYYARSNQAELSFELLQPYTEQRLSIYREAESRYETLTNTAWDEAIELLNAGEASQTFYDEYDSADEARQNQLVNEYYSSHMRKNPKIQQAWDDYQDAASIVPVALDLGIVRLTRATSMSDPVARQEELSAAESMFLSVKSYAGDTDEYQLYLGQVYYWLGKAEEGDALFDSLINKYERSDAVLGSIARVLRDLGAEGKAKAYTEEAYEKASEADKKEHAYQLYLLSAELDDQVDWLEKSDQSQVWVQADLHSIKAALAERDGNDDKAANLYQKAIDTYLSMGEGQYSNNNIALIYMRKYRLVGDESDYDAALLNMDKAVQLSPDDRIVLSNAADYYKAKIYRVFLKNKINLDVLNYSPSIDLVQYFYNNEDEKKRVLSELSGFESFEKMVEYTKKSVLLAPKNRAMFSNAFSTFSFFRLKDDVHALANRLDDISLENVDYQTLMDEYRSGLNDDEELSSIEKGIADFKQEYAQLNAKKHPLEWVVYSSDLVKAKLRRFGYGDFFDVSSDLKIVESNYRNYPSSSTLGVYREVLIHDIIFQLREQSADFKQFFDQYYRIYSNESLLGMAGGIVSDFNQKLRSLESAKKLGQLLTSSEERFPYNPSPTNWYLALALGEPVASKIQQAYLKYDLAPALEKVAQHTYLNQEELAINRFINNKIKGQDAEAKKVLRDARDKSLKIPEALVL